MPRMRACSVVPWLSALCLFFIPPSAPTVDGDALLTMMNKWGTPRPSNWTGDNPCALPWEGVQCDSNSRVSHLNLSNKGLMGEIPMEVGSLNGLVNLDLSNTKNSSGEWNHITGDLSALSNLGNLQSLNLTFNELNGSFPMVVLQLTRLTDLRLDNCNLNGAFPQGLSNLKKLRVLYLGNNTLVGALPTEFGELTNLIELSLWGIAFNSSIPTQLSALSNLQYLTLHDCHLFGGLPFEFAQLGNLERMYLYGNELTGPVPDTWKNMSKLKDLQLNKNSLTKSFPSWIQDSATLSNVDLSYNYLYGPVTNITNNNIKELNIACNFFTGPDPSSNIEKFTDSQNCFANTVSADNRDFCGTFYTCMQFYQTVIVNEDCPHCPIQQYLSNGSSCICVGEGSAPSGSTRGGHSKAGPIIGAVVGVIGFLLLGLIGFFTFKRHKFSERKDEERTGNSKYMDKFSARGSQEYWDAPKGVQRFSLEELGRATAGFSSDHEIGVGGFGKVFYGKLENGKEVAIKRASSASMQGGMEFRNEVILLSRLHHRNLVRLEGFCEDNDLQILVYEFVPNGNLHSHLFLRADSQSFDWLRRLDIAIGVAQGLDYLHSFADPPVIHRDVKPSNILLDNNMIAKVADFGISKATMEFETHISTTPAGTAGYIDPQYFLRRHLTTASDVYGFGVVLLELITGQKAIDPNRAEDDNLVEWVKIKIKMEKIEGIIDPRIRADCPLPVYQTVTQLALCCASFNKSDRPLMKEVVDILDKCLRSACPAPVTITTKYPFANHDSAIHVPEDEETDAHEVITFSSTLSASKSAFKEGDALMPR